MKNRKALHFLIIFTILFFAGVNSQAVNTDQGVGTATETAIKAVPAASPIASPAGKSVEKPVEKPIEKPAEKPLEKTAEKKADKKADKIIVAYFTQRSSTDFEKNIQSLFVGHDGNCKNCEIVNETPYAKDGSLDMTALVDKVKSLTADQVSFLFFDFNLKAVEANKALVEALNKKADENLILISSAGIPADGDASGPLSRTVIGQVHNAVIIGELSEKDRLMPANSFYGPEMLTALRPPKELLNQGEAPLLFTAALAQHWTKRKPQGWLDYFKNKKMRNRRIWLEFGDFF